MEKTNLEKLKELLGEGFSEAELEDLLKEFPQLAEEGDSLKQLFSHVRPPSALQLPADFNEKVMSRLQSGFSLQRWFKQKLTWRPVALATAAVMVLFLGLFFLPRWFQGTVGPGLEVVKETTGSEDEKIYWVRFAIRQPGAESVALVGDFNQWNAQKLKKEKEETFSVKLKLREGTYAYGFMVDGKRWVPDSTADRIVPDGFGGFNSLINL